MLGGFLDLAAPTSLVGDTLCISLPARHKAAAEKLEAESGRLAEILTEIAGRIITLTVAVSRKPATDPTRDQVSRILGAVDERERP